MVLIFMASYSLNLNSIMDVYVLLWEAAKKVIFLVALQISSHKNIINYSLHALFQKH